MLRLHLDTVTRKMLLPLALAGVAMLLAVVVILMRVREQNIEAAGVAAARSVASQMVSLRQYYTAEIATRAIQAGMQLEPDFERHPGTLPLPATLVKALGKRLEHEYPGMSVRLYSRYPFPKRAASETYDAFETRALTALIAAPEQPQLLIEQQHGQRQIRYVVADRMQAGCVACHNARSDSPKRDWQVGDVRGAIEVTVPIEQVERAIDNGILSVGLTILAGIVALGSVAILATRRAAQALQGLNTELEDRVERRTRDLSQANAHLHEAMQHIQSREPLAALGALIAGMAHELNTPMGNATLVVSTLSELVDDLAKAVASNQLRKTRLDEFIDSATQACALLQRNILRAAELVADFKQVAVDQTSLRRREFNLLELVTQTLHTIGPSYKHQPVIVTTEVPSAIRLDSYPGALEQVITNLINNAVLHGQRADCSLNIQLTAQPLADIPWVKLSICDDGQGMSSEVAAQAFGAFFTTRANSGGSGLGLHLVRQLVQETLGGSLQLDTQSGRGTCFDIVLPLQAPLSPEPAQP